MSEDKMQDVFPIDFDFEKGEQPDDTKFTGWRKQTDAAFSRVTRAIGDPWEYNTHIGDLSPEKLAQASLARMIGPSDYASPQGASWNESVTSSVTVTLEANRNSWRLGFPLKKKISNDISPAVTGGYSTVLEDLVFGTDIISNAAFSISNLKTTLEEVVDSGDFHIDYDTGIVTRYDNLSSSITWTISDINMLGPGVPWGTANVIPSWNQTADICNAALSAPGTYIISLPLVTDGSRATGSTSGPDATWNTTIAGQTARHRLPYSITSSFYTGEEIPEGFMYLWEESTSRIMSLVTFKYLDDYNIRADTPVDWLTVGDNYRLIVTGTSLAENISYLNSVVRDGTHSGLENAQDTKTIMFTNPISHENLADLYNGDFSISVPDEEPYQFTKSNYPTNPHPQYLHRAGYMTNDAAGNTGNAMRGDLVFAGTTDFELTTTIDADSYGLRFGSSTATAPSISFQGASSSTVNLNFALDGIGIVKNDLFGGALTISSYKNNPLYLKSEIIDDYDSGASISFDYYNNTNGIHEMNYMKLVPGDRDGADDVPNLPADLGAVGFDTTLDITPSLSAGLSSEQIREWRFRGVSYNRLAINDGLTTGGDYDKLFTSPGMVGADFINVYSNAIFFSEEGDGKKTSFTSVGDDWLDNHTSVKPPVGIYYEPKGSSGEGAYRFVTADSSGNRESALVLSRYGDTTITCNEDLAITGDTITLASTNASATSISIGALVGGVHIGATLSVVLDSLNEYIKIGEHASRCYVWPTEDLLLGNGTTDYIYMHSAIDLDIQAGNSMVARAAGNLELNANYNVSGGGYLMLRTAGLDATSSDVDNPFTSVNTDEAWLVANTRIRMYGKTGIELRADDDITISPAWSATMPSNRYTIIECNGAQVGFKLPGLSGSGGGVKTLKITSAGIVYAA